MKLLQTKSSEWNDVGHSAADEPDECPVPIVGEVELDRIAKSVGALKAQLATASARAPEALLRKTLAELHELNRTVPEDIEQPADNAFASAYSIVTAGCLHERRMPSRVGASTEGSLVIEYAGHGRRYCLFECYNSGVVAFLYSEGMGMPEVRAVDFLEFTSQPKWSSIARFCDGDANDVV